MKNNKIGEMLKLYRKQNNMTVPDVCVRLREDFRMDVAEKTVYGWESNQAHPTADTFVAMCELYHIDNLSEAYSSQNSGDTLILTEEEKQLVRNYRKYPAFHAAIRQLLHMESRKDTSVKRRSRATDTGNKNDNGNE